MAISDPADKAAYDVAMKAEQKRIKGIQTVADRNFGTKDPQTDIDGWRILETKDPLEYAGKLARAMADHKSPSIDTLESQVKVALLRGKVLQAVGALRAAHELDATSPRVALMRVQVLKAAHAALEESDGLVPGAGSADPGAAAGGGGDGQPLAEAQPARSMLRPAARSALLAALQDVRVSGGCSSHADAIARMQKGSEGQRASMAWRLARAEAAAANGDGGEIVAA